MDKQDERPVRIEDLRRWARIADRFGATTQPEIVTKPETFLKIGALEIRTLADWKAYWEAEIEAKHWDRKIAAISVPDNSANLKDLIRRIENLKKKPGESE